MFDKYLGDYGKFYVMVWF